MFKNPFNAGGPLRADRLYIHDGGWMATIILVLALMVFNDETWSYIGLALIYIILGLHVLTHYKSVQGNSDIWTKRGIVSGAWLGSLILPIIMPIFAAVEYAKIAKDIREKYSDKEYNVAWKIYMRMLGLVTASLIVFLVQSFAPVESGLAQ